MLQKQLSFLILSYDGFSDIWLITVDYFFKYWPDCPYTVYLITNHKTFDDTRVISLKVGEDISWSSNVKKALEQIDTDYVLTIFDDFILKSPIENQIIETYVRLCLDNNYDYLRLQPEPPPHEKKDPFFGRITEGSLYRVSLCTTIIKKETLKQLLCEEENAWAFEFEGSIRSDRFSEFYSTFNYIIPYHNAIEKGKWRKEVLEIVQPYGIDVTIRGIHEDKQLSNKLKWVHFIKKKILFEWIPAKFQRAVLNFYHKILKSR
jgi:hypothetical protein